MNQTSTERLRAFREMMLTDSHFRDRFANDPVSVLAEAGLTGPTELFAGAIDRATLEQRVAALRTTSAMRDVVDGPELGRMSEAALRSATGDRTGPVAITIAGNVG
ncbi:MULTISPECIES: hypothetical protein [unclassified Anaeromyxobacter]|uniref:hypothetical protein n=1 Tax=unclassified Anaeromyxobacter TaxID=2620896 RepID=UPI001F58BD8C|nr:MULTISPECIES: hypothetical protein [unclassified Anaeromyxobacter]